MQQNRKTRNGFTESLIFEEEQTQFNTEKVIFSTNDAGITYMEKKESTYRSYAFHKN